MITLLCNVDDTSAANSTFNQSSVTSSSQTIKNYVETTNKIPSSVTIVNQKVTTAQFLYLATSTVLNINKSKTTPVTLRNVSNPSNPSESLSSGTLTKTEYLSIANKINKFINSYGRVPNYVSTSLGTMKYETMVYSYAKILAFYKTNKRLPNTVSVKPFNSTNLTGGSGEGKTSLGHGLLNGLQGTSGLVTLQNYIYKNLNHQYGASTTAAGVEKTGLGDCWGLSAWTSQVLHDNGYAVRIVQGSSVEASNHRWVQTKINGSWVNFDPSLVTKKYWWGQAYYVTCASVNCIIATYT
jgi:hypothetical protein